MSRSGIALAERVGVTRSRTSTRSTDVPAWFAERNEGEGLDVVFEMSGALGAVHDAFEVVRHGGHVVLFGIPARPAEIDIAESLIFKNLTVSAVNGREIWATWYTTRWLLEHGVDRPAAADHRRAAAGAIRGGVRSARIGRGLQDRAAAPGAARERAPPRRDRRRARRAARRAAPTSASTCCSRRRGRSCEMEGRGEVIILSSNNYLGLAGQPRGRRARHRRPRPLRRRHRLRAVHLRHVRACTSSSRRSSRSSRAPRRRSPTSRAGTRTRRSSRR